MRAPGIDRPSASAKTYLVGLDLVRIAAAVGVMLFHLSYVNLPPWRGYVPTMAFARMSHVMGHGWAGVEVFFVLSGYVIAYSMRGKTPWRFAVQRAQRLLPGAMVCAAITGLVLTAVGRLTLPEATGLWLRSVAFLPGRFIDGSYWTLPIEVAFYVLVLCLLAVRRQQWLPGVMLLLTACSGAWWLLTEHVDALGNAPRTQAWLTSAQLHSHTLVVYGSAFALGVYLWQVADGRQSRWTWVSIAVAMAVTLYALPIRAESMMRLFYLRGSVHTGQVLWLAGVVCIAMAKRADTWLRSMLGAAGVRWVRRLGVATYPLYLVHHFVGWTLEVSYRQFLPPWPAMLLAACSMVSVALVVSQWAEPAVRWVMFEWPVQVWAGRRRWLGWGTTVPSYGNLLNPPPEPRDAGASAALPLGQEHASGIRR